MKMICEICKKEFRRRGKQKYCSDKCRYEGWKHYLVKRYAEKENNARLERIAYIERLRKQDSPYLEKLPDRPIKISDSALQFLIEIAKRQQFTEGYVKKKTCEACGCSNKELVSHHVLYIPPEIVTLCHPCHTFLHINLLGKKRVKPRFF